jgi:predicted Rossmann-fold nucleotide-binding protein
MGIGTPPEVSTEIEDLEEKIKELEEELDSRAKQLAPTNISTTKAGDNQKEEDASLHIMVTGGRKLIFEAQIELANLIGQQIILRNHNLITNGAKGIDKESTEGAIKMCRLKNLKPTEKIQVYRPYNAPKPRFDFDNGKVVRIGKNYDERRNFVVHQSDVIILLGGAQGTRDVVTYAQIACKPFIPIGIGSQEQTAVDLWHKMYQTQDKYLDDLPIIRIASEDLQKIGPKQEDLYQVALSSILIAENWLFGNSRPKTAI